MTTEAVKSKIETANEVLASFAKRSRIERRPNGWYVIWDLSDGRRIEKRWHCRCGQDFYPTWSQKWLGGGTSCTALSQLIRWLRGQPVLPIATWEWWANEKVKLLPMSAVAKLLDAGYPDHANCVLCGERIVGSLDWWHLDGVSGPCCGWTSGCRQNPDHANQKLVDACWRV